eukprot:GHVT01004388.1.p1 GENE.GHVT01004388.1~~GHVT01004388.1.p1  ORF type:complete len:194 (+),score=52.74 GHVT01004388.1:667-1248(+)
MASLSIGSFAGLSLARPPDDGSRHCPRRKGEETSFAPPEEEPEAKLELPCNCHLSSAFTTQGLVYIECAPDVQFGKKLQQQQSKSFFIEKEVHFSNGREGSRVLAKPIQPLLSCSAVIRKAVAEAGASAAANRTPDASHARCSDAHRSQAIAAGADASIDWAEITQASFGPFEALLPVGGRPTTLRPPNHSSP